MAIFQQVAGAAATWTLTVPNIPLMVPEKAMAAIAAIEADAITLALQTIAGFISEEAPRNTGELAQSFLASPPHGTGGYELFRSGDAVTGGRVFSSLPYAVVMEEGRSPGHGISREGMAALALWVRRKLGLSGKEAERATAAIAWSIYKKGIAGKHYVAAALPKAESKVEAIFNALGDALGPALTKTA